MTYEVLAEQYKLIGMDSFIMTALICSAVLCLCISAIRVVDGDTLRAVSTLILSLALLTLAAYINTNFKTHIIIIDKSDVKYAEIDGYEHLYTEGVLVAMTKDKKYKQKERVRRRRNEEVEVEDNSEIYSTQKLP